MGHELNNPHVARRRQLNASDASSYQTLRMSVQRSGMGQGIVSLIFTNVGGGRLADTRLAATRIALSHPDGEPLSAEETLRSALAALFPRG